MKNQKLTPLILIEYSSLIGMMKIGYLKRLESSIHSFSLSIKRTIDKISEIDVSKLSIEETVNVISYVIEEKLNFPAGEIDFMDWLISNL